MSTTHDESISVLNDLIETNKDGEEGFRTAAEGVENTELRTMFNLYAQQRARFASELNVEVLRLGGKPAESGHTSAALHRGWINVKSAVTGKNEKSIVDECERGEDSAKKNYEDALKKSLPSDLLSIVESQYTDIKAAHDSVRDLKRMEHGQATV